MLKECARLCTEVLTHSENKAQLFVLRCLPETRKGRLVVYKVIIMIIKLNLLHKVLKRTSSSKHLGIDNTLNNKDKEEDITYTLLQLNLTKEM